MLAKFTAVLGLVWTSGTAFAAVPAPSNLSCHEKTLPVESVVIESPDVYRAPFVEGGQRRVLFRAGTANPIGKKQILEIFPEHSAALLNDYSAVQFTPGAAGDGSIVNVRHVAHAGCWSSSFSFGHTYEQNGRHEIILSGYVPGAGRELLRLENQGGRGKISRVVQFTQIPDPKHETSLTLLISRIPFDGFGVSAPSIEGAWRSLTTITKNRDGSLIVGGYAYAIRAGSIYPESDGSILPDPRPDLIRDEKQ